MTAPTYTVGHCPFAGRGGAPSGGRGTGQEIAKLRRDEATVVKLNSLYDRVCVSLQIDTARLEDMAARRAIDFEDWKLS